MLRRRLRKIEQLYHEARDRDPRERAAFLEQACAGDEALRSEVESLLAEESGVRTFLETPALELAGNMSGEGTGQSMIGRQFGPYSVVSLLGKGGMGEVYRAHDSQLQRDVALKLLPHLFASDPERLARFQREAQVLATLNHPNIAQIYGLEGSGTSRCIVMELVDGDTLEVWSRDGKEVFYRNADKMMAVAIETRPAFTLGTPKLLFQGNFGYDHRGMVNYDISPDGRRFSMIHSQFASVELNVILDWFSELQRRAPAKSN